MRSTKPYLIRAIYEWCADEGFTPYLAVQVDAGTQVPREFVQDGQIVLNVSADATQKMQMGNDQIMFQARFNGASFPVLVPVGAVVAIYARENGQGMAFEATPTGTMSEPVAHELGAEASVEGETSVVTSNLESAPRRGSHLTRIK